jgi:hypothetical protein
MEASFIHEESLIIMLFARVLITKFIARPSQLSSFYLFCPFWPHPCLSPVEPTQS